MTAPETAPVVRRDSGILAPFRSLLTAQVIGTSLGLLFWIAVARLVPGREVGVAAAAISTQTLLGAVTALGLGTLLIAELPRHPGARQRVLVLRSLAFVGLAAVVVGGGVALLARAGLLGPNLEAAVQGLGALVLVVGVAVAGWAVVLDEAVLGLRRSRVQVGRNLAASGLRFPLAAGLLLAGHRDALVLMACWVLPLLVSLVCALGVLRLPRGDGAPHLRADLTAYARPALRHHALNLSLAAGAQLMPVVAAVTLTPVGNAQFAIAWLVATFVFLPPYLLAVALFAHGANVPVEEFRTSMATTLPASLCLSLALCAGAWLLGRPALEVFGGGYAAESWTLLALLVPAGLWMVVKDHLVALWRVQQRFGLATRLLSLSVVLEVTGAAVGAVVAGGTGLCLGWLSAIALEVLLAIPLLRSSFGGLPWQRPALSALSTRARTEQGAASWAIAGAASVLAVAVAFGVVAAVTRDDSGGSTEEAAIEKTSCPPTDNQPGPLVDLGVQGATGDPARPNLDQAELRRLVGLAADAGAQVVSTSYSWRTGQPRRGGPYQWAGLDAIVDTAIARGLDVRVQLVGLPRWAREGDSGMAAGNPKWRPPVEGRELERWAGFVGDVVKHLRGRVDYLEVWDEPNSPDFWATGPDPAAFARLLEVSYDAVKAVDPSVRVISGSLAGNDLGYLEQVYDALEEEDRPERPFDMVGLHPYTNGAPPDVREPEMRYEKEFGQVDHSFLGYRDIHGLMTERGDGEVPIYVGEFGYSTEPFRGTTAVSDEVRSEYLTQAFAAVTCTPYVSAMSWYYLHPTPWNPESWTLLDASWSPNATYDALRVWSTAVQAVR
ncbi:hypothetical protein [Nocardioides dongkuii]|uniref:hypothetical protein n=1 Tax=Nocardioides dongkuii TaxID=2760089 RepID=UPI0018783464|nr:hypothetical protein [Nocardioides dongkuii]